MPGFTVGQAGARTGWSPRMLRYLERSRLIVPGRNASGYRVYGLRELNLLRSLRELRNCFGIEIAEVAFAARLEREPALRAAVGAWLAGSRTDWVDWEQRKQERLLAA